MTKNAKRLIVSANVLLYVTLGVRTILKKSGYFHTPVPRIARAVGPVARTQPMAIPKKEVPEKAKSEEEVTTISEETKILSRVAQGLHLQGILYSIEHKEHRYAIISNRVFSHNEHKGGLQILEINKRSVKVKLDSTQDIAELAFKEDENLRNFEEYIRFR